MVYAVQDRQALTPPDQMDRWVIVDLEDSYNIDAVCVYWETACPNTYIIELSDDGEVGQNYRERIRKLVLII